MFPRTRRELLMGLVSLSVILTCSVPLRSALAAGARAAALLPRLVPAGSVELRDRFHDAVTRGLESTDTDALGAAEVRTRLAANEELRGCDGAGPCATRLAGALHVDRLVATEITIAGKQYTVRMRMFGPTGAELGRSDDGCDICSIREAEELLVRMGKRIVSSRAVTPATPPPVTSASTTGPAATAPAAPPAASAAPQPSTPTAPPLPSEPNQAAAPPGPVAPAPAAADRRPFPYRWVAVGALAAGVLAIAIGAPLVAIDGRPTCDRPDAARACPELYDTVAGGATLLTLGVVGVVASGALFYLDWRSRRAQQPRTLSLRPSALGLQLGGTF